VSKHLCFNLSSNEISPGIKFQVADVQAMNEYPVLNRNVNKQFGSTVLVYIFTGSLTDRLSNEVALSVLHSLDFVFCVGWEVAEN